MGWNDHDDDLDDLAQSIAAEAEAVSECPAHSYVLISEGDDEANTLAYKIATKRAKELDIPVRELTDAVKRVIDGAADECTHPSHFD